MIFRLEVAGLAPGHHDAADHETDGHARAGDEPEVCRCVRDVCAHFLDEPNLREIIGRLS